MARNYETEYNRSLEPGDIESDTVDSRTRYAPIIEGTAAADADRATWNTGYETLKKQMGALQGQTDVYKRRSPLDANTHIHNIAKSLAKDYGVTSIGDIGVRYETRPAYETGSDESATIIPEQQVPIYYNKKDPSKIIPGYKFASEGKGDGYSDYNLQPVRQADGSTIVVPIQQYSKSGMGAFVEDLGPIIQVASLVAMAAGAPPLYVGAANLGLQGAAGNIDDFNDALRIAAPYLIPAGLQGLDIVGPSTASTVAGRVAENYGGIAGLTGFAADVVGSALSDAAAAGLAGGDVGASALGGAASPLISAGIKSVASGAKDAYKGLTGFNFDADLYDIGGSALENFGPTTTDINAGAINLANTTDELDDLVGGLNKLDDSAANNLFGNLTDADLDDLYGSTAPNTGAVTSGVTLGSIDSKELTDLPVNTMAENNLVTGNLTDADLDELYGSTVSNASAGSGKTVEDLYSMDANRGNTGDTIYTDKNGDSYFVDDNGDVQSLTKGQADTLLTTDIAENTGLKLDPVEIEGKLDSNLGYDWAEDITKLTEDTGLKLDPVTIIGKLDPNLGYDWEEDTTLTEFGPTTSDLTALDTKNVRSLTTGDFAGLTTSNLTTLDTKDTGGLTATQIGLLTAVGTGVLVSDVVGGKDTKSITTLDSKGVTTLDSKGATTLDSKIITTLDSKNITTLDSKIITTLDSKGVTTLDSKDATTLDSKTITTLTTMDPLGLKGIADPANRFWNQTGATGTGGQGGVRFFEWTTNPVPVMGGSNMEAAKSLIPAFTSAQVQAMAAPTPKQYFNAATNRYYTDPTGQATPPAGFVQKTFKDGGEVKTKHFDNGGFSFADFDLDINPYKFADFDLGVDFSDIDFSGPDFSNFNFADYDLGIDLGSSGLNFADYDLGIGSNTMSDADVNQYLRDLPSDNASYGDYDRTASYQQDIRNAASGSSALSGVAKTVVDKLAGMGAKLTESALRSIENNPGAWLAALAGAGLGYAASRNNTMAPIGLQNLGITQQQVYNTLKGGNYVGKATGGEIPGYGAGGGLHYLKSAEDGMADKIPATIDNKQPARLSGGEFVIPADVVSHLGNGNSEAGAKQLYEMMDRIRRARTGNKEQGKKINPAKFTPK